MPAPESAVDVAVRGVPKRSRRVTGTVVARKLPEKEVVRQVRQLLDILVAQGYCTYVRIVSSRDIGGEGPAPKGQPDIVGVLIVPAGCRSLAFAGAASYTTYGPYHLPFAIECKGGGKRVAADSAQRAWLEAAQRQAWYAPLEGICGREGVTMVHTWLKGLGLPVGELQP